MDLIERKAAIDEVKRLHDVAWANWKETRISANTMIDALKDLPSAQPERKKGEWIPEFDGKFTGGAYWFSCSKCKRIVPEVRNGGWNFCPQFGADMRGEHR